MTSALGSVTISGLLGGTAGKIDTDALVQALMKAKAVPQQQLKDKLQHLGDVTANLQEVNSRMQAITDAARDITDIDFGTSTSARSSSSNVSASSTANAVTGSSTFHVDQLARAQVSTIATDTSGNVSVTGTFAVNGTTIDLGGDTSAAHVAEAINGADVGVRAAVINVDDGAGGTKSILQLSAAKTGTDHAFTVGGVAAGDVNAIVTAQDAQISVGDPTAGGYTISSQNNTFADAMPGVTFSLGAGSLDTDVTISVSSDVSSIVDKIQALVDAVNHAKMGINKVTGKNGVLQGHTEIASLRMDMASVISSASPGGASPVDFGLGLDKDGSVTFDAAAFRAAYATGPQAVIDAMQQGLASPLRTISENASAPITGTISQAITSDNSRADDLSTQISKWDDRLDDMETQMKKKYIAMQTALAKLQSQGDWLTNMFKSMNASKDD